MNCTGQETVTYLDNSATTPLDSRVLTAMTGAAEVFANPSSLHRAGCAAAALLSDARDALARAAGLRQGDNCNVIFTGSGSEANNLALLGTARAKSHRDSDRIIITDSEHPSVTRCAERLAHEGFEVVKIPTRGGRLDLDALRAEASRGAFAVSLMLVNNETGALYDIPAAAACVRSVCPGAYIHCDAVQGFLRVALPALGREVDMISVSAHKIHGPKGVGALLVSPAMLRRRAISPVIYGGGQESGLRSGTENVIGIAGFGKAAELAAEHFDGNAAAMAELYSYAADRLRAAGVTLNIPENPVHHIISLTLPGIKSQTMLNFLSARGICVSSGSACSSHDRHISPTLLAFGLNERGADCTLRVSLSRFNARDDIDRLTSALSDGISSLIRIK